MKVLQGKEFLLVTADLIYNKVIFSFIFVSGILLRSFFLVKDMQGYNILQLTRVDYNTFGHAANVHLFICQKFQISPLHEPVLAWIVTLSSAVF